MVTIIGARASLGTRNLSSVFDQVYSVSLKNVWEMRPFNQ